MATADEKTQIAVLQNQMTTALAGIDDIKQTLNNQDKRFVLVAVYEPRILALEQKVNNQLSRRWVQNTLSAIFGSILAILIGYFLLNVGAQ